jgi:hypothetical protein
MNGNGVQPLSNWQKNVPHIAASVGGVILLLAMGVQNAAQSNPDLLKDWGNADDLGKMAGAVIMFLGVALSHSNSQKMTAAIDKASKEAPIAADGRTQNSTITLAAGVEQALGEGNHKLAIAVIQALKESDGNGSDALGMPPNDKEVA